MRLIGRRLTGLGLLLVLGLAGSNAAVATLAARSQGPPVAAPVAVGDWPTYGHDNARTNYNPDETLISAGTVTGLVQRWQAAIGSNGTSSSSGPVTSNGRVYVGSSAASPANNYFAFDASSGTQVWAKNIGYRSSCFNVGIGSTAAISGTALVVGEDNAQSNPAYHALNTIDGTVIWTNTMSVGSSGFPWESPLLAYGRAYVGISSRCDNPSVRGELRAVDLGTGTAINSAYFVAAGQAGGGIWNSPALSPDGTTLVLGTGEDYSCSPCTYTRAMVALDPQTLQILQYHQEPSPNQDLDFGTTPVIFHDSQGRTLVGAGHKNGTFYTYDITNINGGAIWSRTGGTVTGLMPAYDPTFGTGGTLFIISTAGLTAVDPATGGVRWGPVTIGTSHGNIAIANGLIFVNGGSGGLQIRSETDGSLLRTLTPPSAGSSNSGVTVSNGFIYWVSGSYLNAWSLPAGTATPTPSPGPPTATATATAVVPTPSNTATLTPVVASTTPTVPSATPVLPTVTRTNTPVPPTVTSTPSATSTSCPIGFSDVQPSDYFYTPVLYLACRGVVGGYADGTFRPYNNTTRGQMAKIVILAESLPIQTPAAGSYTFADVPPTDTFYPYIETAVAHSIVGGYACGGANPQTGVAEPCDGSQRPYYRAGNFVTRGQLTKIVVGAAQQIQGWTLLNPPTASFSDVPIGSTFYQYIETAVCHHILGGYADGTFHPADNAFRGQIAKIVYNTVTDTTTGCP